MIACLRDAEGNITAVIEYLLFNQQGNLDENGDGMFIGECEINPIHRGNGALRELIKMLLAKCPKAKKCVFFRKTKYPEREHRTYTREQFELLTRG
jgi:hypothetical protein